MAILAAILDFWKIDGVWQGDLTFSNVPGGYLSENEVKYSGAFLSTEPPLATGVLGKVQIYDYFVRTL